MNFPFFSPKLSSTYVVPFYVQVSTWTSHCILAVGRLIKYSASTVGGTNAGFGENKQSGPDFEA